MRHRDYTIGHRAIKRVPLPLVNVPGLASPDQPELAAQRDADRATAAASKPPGSTSGASAVSEATVGLRALTGTESALALRLAGKYSRDNGGTGLVDDPHHVIGLQVYTLAIACVDPDSNPENPTPFFGERNDIESAAREILESPHIGRDGIAYLMDHQEMWQAACSPQTKGVSPEKMLELAMEAAKEDDPRGFLALGPATRWSCFRFMAALWLSSTSEKSSTGQLSTLSATPSTSSTGVA